MSRLRKLVERPGTVYRVLVPSLVVWWFVSGIGGGDKTSRDGGLYYAGATGWALFLVTLLVIVMFSVVVVARRLRRTSTSH